MNLLEHFFDSYFLINWGHVPISSREQMMNTNMDDFCKHFLFGQSLMHQFQQVLQMDYSFILLLQAS